MVNIVFLWLVKHIMKPRDNLLGSIGLACMGIFVLMFFITSELSFLLFAVAGLILSFMGGLNVKFDRKTNKKIELFEESFNRKRVI